MRRFAPLLLIPIIVISVIAILFLYQQNSNVEAQGSKITNLTESAFTLTWTTESATKGEVIFKKENERWPLLASTFSKKHISYDDRDLTQNDEGEYVLKDGGSQERYTHHVTVRHLEPETSYMVRINNGLLGQEIEMGEIITTPINEDIKTPDPAYGTLEGISQVDNLLFFTNIENNKTLSTYTAENLSYTFDMNSFGLDAPDSKKISIEIKTENKSFNYRFNIDGYKPLEKLVINTDAETESNDDELSMQKNITLKVNASDDCPCFESYDACLLSCEETFEASSCGAGCDRECFNCPEGQGGEIPKTSAVLTEGSTEQPSEDDPDDCVGNPCGDLECKPGSNDHDGVPLCMNNGTWTCSRNSSVNYTESGDSKTYCDGCYEADGCPGDPEPDVRSIENNITQESDSICTNEWPASGGTDSNGLTFCDYWNSCQSKPEVQNNPDKDYHNGICGTATRQSSSTQVTSSTVESQVLATINVDAPVAVDSGSCCIDINPLGCTNDNEWENAFYTCFDKNNYNAPMVPSPDCCGVQEISNNSEDDDNIAQQVIYGNIYSDTIQARADNITSELGVPSVHVVALECRGNIDREEFVSSIGMTVGQACDYPDRCNTAANTNGWGGGTFAHNDCFGSNGDRNTIICFNQGCSNRNLIEEEILHTIQMNAYKFKRPVTEWLANIGRCGQNVSGTTNYQFITDTGSVTRASCNQDLNYMVNNTACTRETIIDITLGHISGNEACLAAIEGHVEGFCSRGECTYTQAPYEFNYSTAKDESIHSSLVEVAEANSAPSNEIYESGIYLYEDGDQRRVVSIDLENEQKALVQFFKDINNNGTKEKNEPVLSEDAAKEIQLKKKTDVFGYNLDAGWNLVSFPFINKGMTTSSQFLADLNLQGIKATHIAKYENGSFGIFTLREGSIVFSNDYHIIPGNGYFIKVENSGRATFSGQAIEDSVDLDQLNTGWNLVGIISDTKYNSESLIDSMDEQEITADTVSQYESGLYQSVVKENDLLYGDNFNIIRTRGYFVRIEKGGGSFTP